MRPRTGGDTQLRGVLAFELGVPEREVALEHDSRGRPTLTGAPHDLSFSVSHSTELTLVAVCRGDAIGVDVEPTHRYVSDWAVWEHVLSDRELRLLPRAGAARNEALLRTWVAKEALAKAIGLGLAVDLRAIETGPSQAIVELPSEFGSAQAWSLTFVGVPGHVAAVAATPPLAHVDVLAQ